MGNGFGGIVGVALAIRHNDLFARLIFVDAAAGFPEAGKEAFRVMAQKVTAEGMGAIAEIAARRVFHESYLAKRPNALAELRQMLLGIDPEAFVTACEILVSADMTNDLGRIRAPSLVIVGELDAATPPVLGCELAAGIPGALFHELKDCGHCPPLEQPQAFLAAVDGFLVGE
jgi:pimeloyl-ACP methyl ester carboxylesterase